MRTLFIPVYPDWLGQASPQEVAVEKYLEEHPEAERCVWEDNDCELNAPIGHIAVQVTP